MFDKNLRCISGVDMGISVRSFGELGVWTWGSRVVCGESLGISGCGFGDQALPQGGAAAAARRCCPRGGPNAPPAGGGWSVCGAAGLQDVALAVVGLVRSPFALTIRGALNGGSPRTLTDARPGGSGV